MPVGRISRQARDLQTHHEPCAAQSHIGDEPLEAIPPRRRRAGLALVAVDHDHLLVRPAQRHRALARRVLPGSALGVLEDLVPVAFGWPVRRAMRS